MKSVEPDKVKIPPPCLFRSPVPVIPPEYVVLLYCIVVKVPEPKSTEPFPDKSAKVSL